MKNNKFAKLGRKKFLVLILALVLLVCGVIGGSLAWLTDSTTPIANKFSPSDIEVNLTETTADYNMVPGSTISKDPVTWVDADSEDCYLFIKVTESCSVPKDGGGTYSFSDFIAYAIDDGWTQLTNGNTNVSGVYYRVIDAASEKGTTAKYNILGAGTYNYDSVDYTWSDNEVLTKPEVTKQMMDAITDNTKPTLTFTAYAVQLNKQGSTAFEPYEAWQKVSS